jgi:hypothetical protein
MWMLSAVAGALAQSAPPADDQDLADEPRNERRASGQERSFIGQLGGMVRGLRELGPWEDTNRQIVGAIHDVYARNGWNSEEDQFSLKLYEEVSAIPPWNAQERLDKVMSVLGERYDLTPAQTDALRALTVRETSEMLRAHAGEIMQYSMEALQTRVRGEPFNPEQIQRWTKLAQPLFDESRKRFERSVSEFMPQLTPEQQALMQKDVDATKRREDYIAEMGQHWLQGEWQPSDWGLEHDPVQTGQGQATAPAGGAAADPDAPQPADGTPGAPGAAAPGGQPHDGASPNRHGGPHGAPPATAGPDELPPPTPEGGPVTPAPAAPNDPWGQYVTAFIAKYKLTDEQTSVAWRIHGTLKERADQVRARYEEQLAALRAKSTAEAKEQIAAREKTRDAEIEALFDRLKTRLEKLPTRAQREAAGEKPPAPPPAPTSRPAPAG